MYKRAIGSVVAMSLILVIGVGAVVSYQVWFNEFTSGLFVKVEEQTDLRSTDTRIEVISSGRLYFINGYDSLGINEIKIGPNTCSNSSATYSQGIQEIDVSSCVSNLTINSKYQVNVISTRGIFSKELILR